jgi:SAM-dependent methyltransferase
MLTAQPVARCVLCEGVDLKPYAAFAEFTWLQCSCGLIFKKDLAGVASETVVGGEGSFGEDGYGRRYGRRYRHRVSKAVRQLRDACQFVTGPAAGPGQTLLDVGCSLGYTLEAAKELGLTGVGVDVSQTAVDACRQLGFEADVAGLEALPYPDERFSVVVMKHVLEHTAAPLAALRETRRVLRRGGVLFIAVPNAEYAKAARNPTASRFYRPDAHGGIEHQYYYSPATLARMLEKSGFGVVRTHPLLMHGNLPLPSRLVEIVAFPGRWLWSQMLTHLKLRKEFWMVSART